MDPRGKITNAEYLGIKPKLLVDAGAAFGRVNPLKYPFSNCQGGSEDEEHVRHKHSIYGNFKGTWFVTLSGI